MELYENRQCEKIKGLTNDANDVSFSDLGVYTNQ